MYVLGYKDKGFNLHYMYMIGLILCLYSKGAKVSKSHSVANVPILKLVTQVHVYMCGHGGYMYVLVISSHNFLRWRITITAYGCPALPHSFKHHCNCVVMTSTALPFTGSCMTQTLMVRNHTPLYS